VGAGARQISPLLFSADPAELNCSLLKLHRPLLTSKTIHHLLRTPCRRHTLASRASQGFITAYRSRRSSCSPLSLYVPVLHASLKPSIRRRANWEHRLSSASLSEPFNESTFTRLASSQGRSFELQHAFRHISKPGMAISISTWLNYIASTDMWCGLIMMSLAGQSLIPGKTYVSP
jgi:hypothetical protein